MILMKDGCVVGVWIECGDIVVDYVVIVVGMWFW